MSAGRIAAAPTGVRPFAPQDATASIAVTERAASVIVFLISPGPRDPFRALLSSIRTFLFPCAGRAAPSAAYGFFPDAQPPTPQPIRIRSVRAQTTANRCAGSLRD